MKVLIIEDSPTNMKLAYNVMNKSGYDVLQASDADTGLVLARRELPDLILMDIQLPGLDGITATKILKADARTYQIPIIAVTSLAMKGDEREIIEAGCDGYISKPIRYKELLEMAKSLLKGKKE